MKTIDIRDFRGIKVEIEYKEIMEKYANKTKNILTATSPHTDRPNRATPYRTGWIVETRPKKREYRLIVWNKTNWQLTHLLENGHFIANRATLGWASPRKHIKPAYLDVRDPYIHAMKKVDISADFK